ncbi:MAG: hypothetical protein IPP47_33075 [Bryobacterales bacterium]|nr:hypothetical protein [Bryobacterales bacterium]
MSWSVSDPSVFELVNTGGYFQLRALKAGDATLSLTWRDSWCSREIGAVTAATPRPLSSVLISGWAGTSTETSLVFELNGNLVSRDTAAP